MSDPNTKARVLATLDAKISQLREARQVVIRAYARNCFNHKVLTRDLGNAHSAHEIVRAVLDE